MQKVSTSDIQNNQNAPLGIRNHILERVIKSVIPDETIKSTAASLFTVSKLYTDSENACLCIQAPYCNLEFHIVQDYCQKYFQENKKEGASDLSNFLEKGFSKLVKMLKENENAVYDLAIKFWPLNPKEDYIFSPSPASSVVSRYSKITFLAYDDKTGSALFYAAEPNPAGAIKVVFKKIGEKVTLREFFEAQTPKLRT
jgi:hypothetical protein